MNNSITGASGITVFDRSWKRLKRNKLALGGITIIILSVLIAILGYLLTPDSSPSSNNMVLQIGTESPGFSVKMLKIRKNQEIPEHSLLGLSFLQTMLFGKEDPYSYIPINSYRFEGKDITINEYVGTSAMEREESYDLANVVFAKSISKQELTFDGGKIFFYDINNQQKSVAVSELQEIIVENNLVQKTFYFGTDKFGRDILSRMIIGVRVSLSVGFIAVLISLVIGVTLGAIAGYFRGRVDNIIMWFINVIWSIPTLLLVLAITLALGKGFWQIFVAVGLSMWVEVARIIRGQVLSIREIEFVEATRALGFSNLRIIGLHILPNVMGPVMVIAAANFAAAILIEAGLSFLGIGVQPPMPSWGWMMKENYGHIIAGDPLLAIIPGLAIMTMVLAFNLLGNGLRDALDVKTKVQY